VYKELVSETKIRGQMEEEDFNDCPEIDHLFEFLSVNVDPAYNDLDICRNISTSYLLESLAYSIIQKFPFLLHQVLEDSDLQIWFIELLCVIDIDVPIINMIKEALMSYHDIPAFLVVKVSSLLALANDFEIFFRFRNTLINDDKLDIDLRTDVFSTLACFINRYPYTYSNYLQVENIICTVITFLVDNCRVLDGESYSHALEVVLAISTTEFNDPHALLQEIINFANAFSSSMPFISRTQVTAILGNLYNLIDSTTFFEHDGLIQLLLQYIESPSLEHFKIIAPLCCNMIIFHINSGTEVPYEFYSIPTILHKLNEELLEDLSENLNLVCQIIQDLSRDDED
jgi:hypothetical protein